MIDLCIVTDASAEYNFDNCNITYYKSDDVIKPYEWNNYNAVFLIEPYGDNALKSWIGHPHLRAFESEKDLEKELVVLSQNIEIEKKYLVKIPDIKALDKYFARKVEIEQVYLVNEQGTHRIRKRQCGNFTQYSETLKIRINDEKCHEYEDIIDETIYNDLLKLADVNKKPIVKNRYCFVYKRQYFELDVYSFWDDKATLELELACENQAVFLPPEIEIIKDVTNDKRYKNNYLARKINEDS